MNCYLFVLPSVYVSDVRNVFHQPLHIVDNEVQQSSILVLFVVTCQHRQF
jgi:hypothetical protein